MNGWIEACANGQVGCMGGLIDVVGMGGWVGAEMVSSIDEGEARTATKVIHYYTTYHFCKHL